MVKYDSDRRPDDLSPTTELYIPMIVSRTSCVQHKAEVGENCYGYPAVEGPGWYTGICNNRALSAGMNGRISTTSLVDRFKKSSSARIPLSQ